MITTAAAEIAIPVVTRAIGHGVGVQSGRSNRTANGKGATRILLGFFIILLLSYFCSRLGFATTRNTSLAGIAIIIVPLSLYPYRYSPTNAKEST